MERQRITTFQQAAAYLDETPRFTSKHTVEETKAFLHRLGDPDRRMRILHVAGTNGKGSVCAYLRGILEAAGYRVALFTSPHLVCIRERFQVAGEMISEEDFLRAFRHIYNMLDWGRWSGRRKGPTTLHISNIFFSSPWCCSQSGIRISASWRPAWAAGWTQRIRYREKKYP